MNSMDIQKIKMDEIKTIGHYTGFVIICIALFMIIPIVVSIIYHDSINYLNSFIYSTIISLATGIILYFSFNSKNLSNLSLKGSLIFVLSVWILSALFCALPMLFSRDLSFIDAYFEGMSGITSTGFTMYSAAPVAYSIRIWRSLLQWFGGLGIIFLLLVLIPSSVNLKRLYFAEGKTEQMTPNIRHTSVIFIKVYAILTIIAISLYVLVGLDVFYAICYSFSGLGTGGFSADPNNLNYFSNPLIQIVTMIVMIMGATNFILHYHIMKGKWRNIHKNLEIRYMLYFIVFATIIVMIGLLQHNFYNQDILVTFRHALFQVISILTSTGFQTTDINNWPALSYHVLILLMFIGGSVCSTASGIKIYNIAIMIKIVWWEIQSIFLPKHIIIKRKVYHDNKLIILNDDAIKQVLTSFIVYLLLFVVSTMIVLMFCNDFQIAYSIVAGSIGNTGLGPSYINPSIPFAVKIVLIFDFLVGRIGIWPALLPLVYLINNINDKL